MSVSHIHDLCCGLFHKFPTRGNATNQTKLVQEQEKKKRKEKIGNKQRKEGKERKQTKKYMPCSTHKTHMHRIPMQNNKEAERKVKPKWAFFLFSSICAKDGTLVIVFYLFTYLFLTYFTFVLLFA